MAVSVSVADAVAIAVLVGVGDAVEVGVGSGVGLATVGDTAATGGDVGLGPQLAMLPEMMTSSRSAGMARMPLAHRRFPLFCITRSCSGVLIILSS